MSEMAKTVSFVAAGVVALLAAYATSPGSGEFDVQKEVGKQLNQFSVDDAKRLRLVTFDQDTATTSEFEVAEDDGLWTIPSKQGYPADAVKQMADAATCLIEREVLRVAAESADRHAELGLVDPTSSNLSASSAGVGTRVVMTDNDGATLTDMIIGSEVADAEEQYYVRHSDSDYAYVINLDPEPLTTRFEDWIEKDLLKLSAMDVARVQIKDYSAEMFLTPQGAAVDLDERSEMVLVHDDDDSKWSIEKLLVFDSQQKEMSEQQLAEDEELNEDALRELRYGLADLTIVDVEQKPDGLSADLKAGSDFMNNNEAILSLIQKGFSPVGGGSGKLDLLSSEGEIICTLDSGVEYVLRFGNLKLDTEGGSEEQSKADPNAETDDGIHRYLFVMARLNKEAIEAPELPELPELPEGVDPSEDSAEEEASADDTADESSSDTEETADDSEDSQAEEEQPDSEEAAEESDGAADDDAADDSKEEDEQAALIASYKEIQQERDRLTKEHQDKIDEADQTVKELNERFGDWYYVIDNRVFKDVHLGRDDVIKKKEKEEEESEEESTEDSEDDTVPGVPDLSVEE